jgi:hypothetical protein
MPNHKVIHIPSSFKLGARKVSVKVCPDLYAKAKVMGASLFDEDVILVQGPGDGTLSPSKSEEVFWHEVVHFVLILAGENELNANEDFVERFGALLYQVITTLSSRKAPMVSVTAGQVDSVNAIPSP